MRGVVGPLAALLVVAVPLVAHAQNQARARQRFQEGVRLLEDARFSEAAAALEESLTIRQSPPALFNLGLAYRGMGRYRKAIETFERFVGSASDRHARMRTDAQDFVREMTASLAHVTLLVRGGATEITVDSERVGQADGELELDIDPGQRVFAASRPGYRPVRRQVDLEPGARQRVALDVSAQPLAGHLTVDAGMQSAEIRLDGRLVGRGQWQGSVRPGRHRVDLVAPGHGPQHRSIDVRPGGRDRLAIRMLVVERETSILGRWWFWTGAAALSAGVAVAIVLLLPAKKEPYYDGELGFTVEALSVGGVRWP